MDQNTLERLRSWRVESPDMPGMHTVIGPGTAECRAIQVFRLNLPAGKSFCLETGPLEKHAVLIHGKARLSPHFGLREEMERFDSFYLPGGEAVTITAEENSIFYIPAAACAGIGRPSFRKYDPMLPIGDIHQIHGAGVGRREVMFTLDPNTRASHLICGLTWGGTGAWTSWPPHQHEKDLEEVYCYFDMDPPAFGLHLSYLHAGTETIAAHPVRSGTMVAAPRGYHPTVSSPVGRSTYLWALAAFTPAQRSYDLAVTDPNFAQY